MGVKLLQVPFHSMSGMSCASCPLGGLCCILLAKASIEKQFEILREGVQSLRTGWVAAPGVPMPWHLCS